MKVNKWTLGLAAVGVVSFASALNAEEAKMNPLQTALSSTTISGYVDTSVDWNSIDDSISLPIPYTEGKADGFNLNAIKLSLEKTMDESEWASGYKVDLLFTDDSTSTIKQAYLALRTPVGTGLDWKVGVFDSIIGYESVDAVNNPNFTRSWGFAITPNRHTGILGTYRLSDTVAVAGGFANTERSDFITDRDENAWNKTFLGSVQVTAPEDMGFLSGSTLYAGVVLGSYYDQDNYYIGGTMNTPVTNLKAGLAYCEAQNMSGSGVDASSIAGYLSFKATEKLSLHGRAEYATSEDGPDSGEEVVSLTGTVQYDLWANVVSRAELRWDDVKGPNGDDAVGIYANLIYKF